LSRRQWYELPAPVRAAVERRSGAIVRVVPIADGAVSDMVAVLHTVKGRVFCKAVTADNPLGWMHRNEARLNAFLPDATPRLLWQVKVDGWLVLGFEHVTGRHPDLSVGSPDLARSLRP
jgi:hypothetical protein